MYPLLPWKWLVSALTALVMIAVYADDVARLFCTTVSDQSLVRDIPVGVLAILVGALGPTGYWAPWRLIWRIFPAFNRWFFPDLNGIWVGSTHSNWPVVEKLAVAALSPQALAQADLDETPLQKDAVALEINASLFIVKLRVFATSTNGNSHSLAARPWKDQHSGDIHITNVYQQLVPIPARTDESVHLGAADLVYNADDPDKIRGEYWTRRKWQVGMNTAGTIELVRRSDGKDQSKKLQEYALEEKNRLASG